MFDSNLNKVDFKCFRVDAVTDYALDCINKCNDEKPFFLFLSFLEPHHQNDHNRYEGPVGSKETFSNYEVLGDLKGTKGDWRENYPDYLGSCNSIDKNVGRIIDLLKQNKIYDDTIVIYMSDHGSHFRTRNQEDLCGYDDYKRACHDSCTHTPLIIHGPGFSGGKTIEAMTSLIDLPATILECAGINKPESIEGNNLKRLIDICPKDWPDDIFMQISESQVGRAIRIKEWKYSVKAPGLDGNFYSCSETYTEDFLYDLKNDPYERNNLVACPDFVEKRNELSKLLIKRMTVIGEKVSVILPKIH
jgi:uncharacterized sulfatase